MTEDLIFGISNLLSIEDHSAKSSGEDEKWIEVIEIVRKMRTKWLSQLVKKEKSQIWCVSKHLLSSIESFIEVGNRFVSSGQVKEAEEAYNDSQQLIKLFIILNELGGKNGKSISESPKTSA